MIPPEIEKAIQSLYRKCTGADVVLGRDRKRLSTMLRELVCLVADDCAGFLMQYTPQRESQVSASIIRQRYGLDKPQEPSEPVIPVNPTEDEMRAFIAEVIKCYRVVYKGELRLPEQYQVMVALVKKLAPASEPVCDVCGGDPRGKCLGRDGWTTCPKCGGRSVNDGQA